MEAARFDDLPAEVMYLIFDCISNSSPEALRKLSLVNKTCYKVAAPFLYRKLAIQISSRQKLLEDIAELEKIPQLFDHARCLKVSGRMPLLADEDGANEEAFDPAQLAEELGHSDQFDAEFGDRFAWDLDDGSVEEVSQAWAPLASAIQKFKHLTDLIWVCRNQFPPCLLGRIHQCHPSCRLDLRTFRLRSLRDPVTDPHELDLVQSPCLHSISVKTVMRDSHGNDDYNREAIFAVVALAPNLRHLNMIFAQPFASGPLYSSRGRPKPPWQGFVPPPHILKKGALTSLSYFGYHRGMSTWDLQKWAESTDLSKIHYLMLGDVSDPLLFSYMAQNLNLASLEMLDLSLSEDIDSGEVISELESLLGQLEPLAEFRFLGHLMPSFLENILQRHSPKMRRLTLRPEAIHSNDILEIESHCSLLEYLDICISCDGDFTRHEYGISDFCPKLPHLRDLNLHVQGMSSNLSTEQVARNIWDLVDKQKGGCRLNRLQIAGNQCVILNRSYVEGCSEVESVHVDTYEMMDLEIIRKFREIPTGPFHRF